ncbi:MAG: class I SAM-dependent methyltransferase [Pseudanabaenaceae cyanobacterium]
MTAIWPGEVFVETADFDGGIRRLLPDYDALLTAIARCVPPMCRQVVDLGCGTGELSLRILARLPAVQVLAVDYSPRMLARAKEKIEEAGWGDRWRGYEGDFGDLVPFPACDACVSSLAIHHLDNGMKQTLFGRIAAALTPGGWFWNGDPVLPEAPWLATVYQEVRPPAAEVAEVRARMGVSVEHGHSGPDRLATLAAHLEMLQRAGFETVAVPWKAYGLAVMGGQK